MTDREQKWDNLLTLYAAAEDGFASPLPAFVKDELEGFVNCGVLGRGFAVLACPDCREQKVVGFSCKGRGFCTSCGGRRMTATAADLVEHVLPDVPLRQFVLTLPFELRARVAYDGELLGAVTRTFVDSVLRFYERQLRARGVPGGKGGAVTVVQRVSSDLRLNPHLHSLFLDGVFAEDEDDAGELRFHPLPFLTNDDVSDILQIVCARTIAMLRRKGVIEDDAVTGDAQLTGSEPVLAELAAASVAGTLPAGPALRRKDAIKLRAAAAPEHTKALCASQDGFSLHAATTASAGDAAGREALCPPSGITKRVKYVLRPPIANERVQLLGDDLVSPVGDREARRLVLKRPFSDGTFALDLDPLALLVRLATTVPPPGFHTIRYAGVLAAASRWRARVVPPPPPPPPPPPSAPRAADAADCPPACETCNAKAKDRPPTHRSGYRPWRELLMRAFKIDVESCDKCGGRMKLRALVMTTAGIERYLAWLGEPSDPPRLAPARGPPYFKHPAIRRRLGVPAQAELFDAH